MSGRILRFLCYYPVRMIRNNVDKQVCRLPNINDDLYCRSVPLQRFTVHQFLTM